MFPGYPFMHMPRSQTPVVSPAFAIAHLGLMPSSTRKLSAFTVTTTGYPCFPYGPLSFDFSEFSDAAYAFTTPGFIHTLLAMHAGSFQAK